MNVIVSNRYAAMLSNLNDRIDLIKTINGEFDVDSLIAQFDNFFFNKMILDITAIRNYQDISQIQRLSFGMDMSKIILLLDDSDVVNSEQYISELISMGIYNFTKNINAIEYLVSNPNSYKDVAQYHMLGGGAQQMDNNQGGNNRKNNGNNSSGNRGGFMSSAMGGGNGLSGTRVIGFKDLTDHAGATSLIYMLKKQLEDNYSTLGVELDKNDFLFLNDPDLKSISSKEFNSVINNPVNNYNVILVDVNDSNEEANIAEMIYLIEPSTLMLNKMIRRDRNVLEKIRGKKLVLNKSLLDPSDIREFEGEAGCTVFQSIQPLDDKKDKHRVLDEFLNKLGFEKNRPVGDNRAATRLFNIVRE